MFLRREDGLFERFDHFEYDENPVERHSAHNVPKKNINRVLNYLTKMEKH